MPRSPEARKADRIRQRVQAGKSVTDEDRAYLAAWKPKRGGRRAKGSVGSPLSPTDAAPGDDTAGRSPADPAPSGEPDGVDVAPEFRDPEVGTPAPETPRVQARGEKVKGKASGAGRDWRSKYRAGAADGEREMTCVVAAGYWAKALLACNRYIRKHGGTPAIPDGMIGAELEVEGQAAIKLGSVGQALVLAVDKLLPADVSIGPEVEAGVVSTIVTFQAMLVARRAKKKPGPASETPRQWTDAAPVTPPAEPKRDADPEPPQPNGRGLAVVKPFVPSEDARY